MIDDKPSLSSSQATGGAPPPDDGGHQGGLTREEPRPVQPPEQRLPGSTWESPRKGEPPAKTDRGLAFTILLVLLSLIVAFAYCSSGAKQ
jgi:hypothetical protein